MPRYPQDLFASRKATIAYTMKLQEEKMDELHDSPHRVRILREAARLTDKDRQATYGPPAENLEDIARLWNAYLDIVTERRDSRLWLLPSDVAILNLLQKISRTIRGYHQDNYIDAAAYAAIAGELAELEARRSAIHPE